MAGYEDVWWTGADEVRLHARDYPGPAGSVPVVCLPGLTRNARDFAALAEALSPARRVIAVDFRGRGESGPARDASSYVPATYADDVARLLDGQEIGRFVAVGTSLGGLVTMLLAARGARIAGALLNDIGPDVEAAGLQRIRAHVGKGSNCPTWLHAARTVAEANRDIHPGWGLEEWLGMAKRLYRVNSAGRVVLDYDPRIAEPLKLAEAAPADWWAALDALGEVPVAIVRGERSDMLSARAAAAMAERLPRAELVTVAGVGHAPTLDEPAARSAVERLLARVEEPAVA